MKSLTVFITAVTVLGMVVGFLGAFIVAGCLNRMDQARPPAAPIVVCEGDSAGCMEVDRRPPGVLP
ncbi:MAG: hypothetical protein WC551_11445 [Patescibacteria group bacterium]